MSNNQVRQVTIQRGGTDLIVSAVKSAATNHPVKFGLNILGLLLLFFASGLAPTQDQLQAYRADEPASGDLKTLSESRTQAYMAKHL
jgi:hypothetical protein